MRNTSRGLTRTRIIFPVILTVQIFQYHIADSLAFAKTKVTQPINYVQLYPHVFSRQGPISRRVCLTFDDGPDLIYTPKILDILKKEHVHATFFVLGENAARYPHIIRRIIREGHVLGNHSFDHKNLIHSSKNALVWEVNATEQVIVRITGKSPKWFRAPYGNVNSQILNEIAHLGYRAVNWSVDSNDWKSLSANQVKQNILLHVRPGAIILQHCSGNAKENLNGTVQALPEIIQTLRKKGYQCVTIPEMFAFESKTVHAKAPELP